MDLLFACADAYEHILRYEYRCIIGRKGAARELVFSFSPYEFKHLAGLHKLRYARLKTNSQRILRDACTQKLCGCDLCKADNWAEEKQAVESRMRALQALETVMDRFTEIFWFSQARANAAGNNTLISDGYLIRYTLPDGRAFYFSALCRDTWCGKSIFIDNEKDYAKAQCRYTLLQKIKYDRSTRTEHVLYRAASYQPK